MVVAMIIGRTLATDDGDGSSASDQVVGGRIALSESIVWEKVKMPAAVEPMLPGAVAVKPVGVSGVTLIAGDVASNGIPGLLSGLRLTGVESQQLAAGDVSVNAYTASLTDQPAVTGTALLIPTDAGVSAAICLANLAQNGLARGDCMALLTTNVALREAVPVADRPDGEQVQTLSSAMDRFGTRRLRDSAVLNEAATSGRQANAALALSADYKDAATVASAITYTALANASGQALTDALTQGATAYRAMARAADRDSASAFRAARADVIAADARIDAALDQLGTLGYASR